MAGPFVDHSSRHLPATVAGADTAVGNQCARSGPTQLTLPRGDAGPASRLGDEPGVGGPSSCAGGGRWRLSASWYAASVLVRRACTSRVLARSWFSSPCARRGAMVKPLR